MLLFIVHVSSLQCIIIDCGCLYLFPLSISRSSTESQGGMACAAHRGFSSQNCLYCVSIESIYNKNHFTPTPECQSLLPAKLLPKTMAIFILCRLLVLLLLNAMLFYKLWNLEARAYNLQHTGRDLLHNIQ